jgi:LytS/YehU family sensor histidine kinase
LFYQEKKLVSLKEELDFLEAYLYLLKIRFGENILIDTERITDPENFQVAPASLQMLIENAIKHNVVSTKSPLRITIRTEADTITVANNLQEKITKEASTYVGLRNIMRRYGFLTDRIVNIEKTETEFKVSLPLLTKSES